MKLAALAALLAGCVSLAPKYERPAAPIPTGFAGGQGTAKAKDLAAVDFVREPKLRRAQRRFIPGAAGDPPGPGANSGGLTLYRYRLPCGTVFGHTGNFPGYTQFFAASRDGSRSTVVSANLQLDVATGTPGVFSILHRVFQRAACATLAR